MLARLLPTLTFLLAAALPLAPKAAPGPYAALDAAPGQLPKNVVPIAYAIALAPNPASNAIVGRERIRLAVRKPTATIVLNQLGTRFQRVTLDGAPARVTVDDDRQIATFRFQRPVAAGTHDLAIAYVATLQHSDQGLFEQRYTDENGKPATMWATQFESTDARRAFPCFDEPAFKARFTMSAIVPRTWTGVSNMPVTSRVRTGERSDRVTFQTTPPMSTYLVVLAAGDFDSVHATSDGIKLGVYTARGKSPQAAYALDVMERLMPYFDRYYGVKYPLPKLDSIAIPGAFDGAMENWGGITYVESSLLYDPKAQPQSTMRDVFGIVAHEESHQWNGDLTTMRWWDELWLSEGFATWMETKAPDSFHPEWQLQLDADDERNDAMISDALPGTHPVYVPVHNETEADAVFDEISYTKAGAVLRMLEQYLGPAAFQTALRRYFKTHQYGIGSAADLWRDLSAASGRDVAPIAHAWIYDAGFPLVTAGVRCAGGRRSIVLSQQRYRFDASVLPGSALWHVPLNVEYDARRGSGTPVLLTGTTAMLDGGACNDAPVLVNGEDVGYYRVAYDAATQMQQQTHFLDLSAADRLGLLDDSWEFATSGRSPIGTYLAYAQANGSDVEPHVAGTILDKLTQLVALERGKPGEAAVKTYVAGRLRPLMERLGGWSGTGASQEQLQLRNRVIVLLAHCDDATTIAEGKQRFAELVASSQAFSPLQRQAVLSVAGYAADGAIYEQMKAMAARSHVQADQERYYFDTIGAKDDVLAAKTLDYALHLPAQYASYAPTIVYGVGEQHPELAWKFLNQHARTIFGSLSSFDKIQAVAGVGDVFWNGVPANDLETFMQAQMPPGGSDEIAKAMAGVRAHQTLQTRLLPQIDAYVTSR